MFLGVKEMELGERLKNIRKTKGMTLQKLSEMTNLSMGFLSNIERDLSSPTISHLQKICGALNIALVELIQPSDDNKILVKKEERQEIFYSKTSKIKYELITEGQKSLNGICITMEEGADYGKISYGHSSDEIGIVVKGTMQMEVEGKQYIINEGDTIYIKANVPHKYKNIGSGQCISYWVLIGNIQVGDLKKY